MQHSQNPRGQHVRSSHVKSLHPFGNSPSRLMMTMMAGASAVSPVFAADAPSAPQATQSAPAAEPKTTSASQEPTLAPVIVKGQRETGKTTSATEYKPSTTKIGKIEQDAKDVPQSVTVIPEKLIKDRQNDSMTSALQHVSGISFNAGEGGRVGDNLNLRGFVSYGDLFLDGMRDIAQYNREVFNLDRIEVLRGSASMLFGHGSTGGVINQVSKQPFLADENNVATTIGTHDYYRATADLNKTIGDTSALRLNTMSTYDNGNPTGADSKRFGIAPTFRTGIGTPDEFQIGYYHLNYDNTPNNGFGWVGNRPVDATADKFYGLDSDYQTDSADILSTEYIHRFSNKTQLRTALRYGEFKRDLFATQVKPTFAGPVTDDSAVSRSSPPARGANDQDIFSQTDLSSRFDLFGMKHEVATGFELGREYSAQWRYSGTPGKPSTTVGSPDPADQIVGPYSMQRTNYTYFTSYTQGIYGQDTIEFLPHLKLLAGGRWDRVSGLYASGAGSTASVFERKDRLWSYRTGLIWEPTPISSYYISRSTSFGTSGDLYQYDSHTSQTPPEQTRNTEIGTKWDLFGVDLSLRGSLFRTKKFNERSTDVTTPIGASILSGQRHTDGWEVEATGHLTQKWELFFNFAHMWSNIDRAGNAPGSAATVGGPAANTPTNSGAIWSVYQFMPSWQVGFGADGQSARNFAAGSSNVAPGFVKYDAMLSYDQPRYNIQLNLNNVFNKVYWPQVYNGWAVAGPSRNLQLTTTFKF